MKCNSRPKAVLAGLLVLSLLATGCTAQWIGTALADLPVLLQMALNIGSLVTTLQSGQQLTAAEAQAIQNISTEASKDLNLLQALYNDYRANPSQSGLQQIEGTIAEINQNLPALLQTAHISDPVLAARVSTAVDLILTTVTSFASLIPQTMAPPAARRAAVGRKSPLPQPKDLKKLWNHAVCGPAGKGNLDSAFAVCQMK